MDTATGEFQGVEDHELLYFIGDRVKDPATARRAWDEFYGRRMNGLERVCLRFVQARLSYASAFVRSVIPPPQDVAHDLATEVMVRVWDRLAAQFTKEPAPGTSSRVVASWLAVIAENLWKTMLKGAKRKEVQSVKNAKNAVDEDTPEEAVHFYEDGSFDAVDGAPTAEEALHRTQIQDMVRQGLERLPARERMILRTAIECDAAFGSGGRGDAEAAQELASALDLPVGSARQAKNRAVQALRERLATKFEFGRTHEEQTQREIGRIEPAKGRPAND